MTSSRTVGIVVGAGLLAAWFAAANGSRPAAPPLPPVSAAPDAQLREVQQLLEQTNQLHGAVATMTAPRPQIRNLFQFGTSTPADREAAAGAGRQAPAAVAPAQPALDLEGIADDGKGGLTAIIGGEGRLFLARPGDQVTSRYRVRAIGQGTVELEDLTGGPALTLRLH